MAAASAATADRVSRNSLADTETAAGDYIGTSAKTGSVAGLANGRSKAIKARVFATGTTVENEVRIYRRNATGPTYSYAFSVFVPARTVAWPGSVPWSSPEISIDIELPDANHALAFNKEKNATNLVVEYVVRDY